MRDMAAPFFGGRGRFAIYAAQYSNIVIWRGINSTSPRVQQQRVKHMKSKLLGGAVALSAVIVSAGPAMGQTAHVHGAWCNHGAQLEGNLDTGLTLDTTEFLLPPPEAGQPGSPLVDRAIIGNKNGLAFNLIFQGAGFSGPTGAAARRGFEQAAKIWSRVLADNTSVTLELQFNPLAAGILGSASSTTNQGSYTLARALLDADRTSFRDNKAVKNLETGPTVSFISNEGPNSALLADRINAATQRIDDNNTVDNNNIQFNTSVVKALGLAPVYAASNVNQRDGFIQFSSNFAFDFDPSDGITPGLFDFVAIAIHEIGHVLGFRSGVDLADGNALPFVLPSSPNGRWGLNTLAWLTVHDLYRFGAFDGPGALNGQVFRDMAIGGSTVETSPCFSLDRGETCLGLLSTGANSRSLALGEAFRADGRQASHWKDDAFLPYYNGIMDPTATRAGVQVPLYLTNLDLIAFDAMGWDLAQAVPQPAALSLLGLGVAGLMLGRRRRAA